MRLNVRASRDPALECALAVLGASEEGLAVITAAVTPAMREAWGDLATAAPSDAADINRRFERVAALTDANLRCELAARADHVAIDKTSFLALLFDPPGCSPNAIEDACDRADRGGAVVRALARLGRGEELPWELVAKILPGVEHPNVFLALIGGASGDVVAGLGALLESDVFANDVAGTRRRLFALFALCRLSPGPEHGQLLRRSLRRVLRQEPELGVLGLYVFLINAIADPALQEPFADLRSPFAIEIGEMSAAQAAQLLQPGSMADVVATWPMRVKELPVPGILATSAPKTGRNTPCPCGSGKKFKQCCERLPPARRPRAPRASRDDLVRSAASGLSRHGIERMTPRDLAVIDPASLKDPSLVAWFRRQVRCRDWTRASLAMNEIATRNSLKNGRDGHRRELVQTAIVARRFDVAAVHAASLEAPADAEAECVALAIALDDDDAMARLRRAASRAVADPTGKASSYLATMVTQADPALGILLARGALDPRRPLDNDALLEAIEDARNELLLAPADEAVRLPERAVDRQGEERQANSVMRLAAVLQAQLQANVDRLEELEGRNAERVAELEQSRQRADAARTDDPDPVALAKLRSRIATLEAQIREGNEERGALRRQLTEERDRPPAAMNAQPSDDRLDSTEDELEDHPEQPSRTVLVPRFLPGAEDALGKVPRMVASQALHTTSDLAAGDPAAWRAVKQSKGMRTPVLSARIGIHHRLLFRRDQHTLEVLDLVHRGRLLLALKGLRSG